MNLILLTILVSIFGIAIGSFINVVVFRTFSKKDFVKGRSKCQKCLTPIATIDLIPVISYFALKGRCRNCSSVIAWQYPAVELASGILFGLFFVRAALGVGFPEFVDQSEWVLLFARDVTLAVFLIIIFVYDFKYQYILDRFSIPAIILALVFNLLLGADGVDLLLGGLLVGGFFAVQFLISQGKWIGGGDIRMGLLMGFLLGLKLGVAALFLSYILGAIIGIGLIVSKKQKLHSHVPFGTFLAVATIILMFCGPGLVDWYLALL